MKQQTFLTTVLLTAFSILPVHAQTSTASTYSPGPWQPIARVVPNRDMLVQFVNHTDVVLEYASTTNEAPPRRLPPTATAMLGEFDTPAYFVINSVDVSVPLYYEISRTPDNVIVVRIRKAGSNTPLHSSFNVNSMGAIYAY